MTRMILTIVAVFFAGFIMDVVTTKYTQAIAKNKVWYATLLSGVITIVNFGLIAYLITDMSNHVGTIASYAAGNTVGTFLAMKTKI